MKRTRRWAEAAAVLLVLIAGWSLVHAAASRLVGFSPWKLGGFGMFSAPGDWMDGAIRVGVVFVDPGTDEMDAVRDLAASGAIPQERCALTIQGDAVLDVVVHEGPRPAAVPNTDIGRAVENVMVWPRRAHVDALARHARDLEAARSPDARVVVTRTVSRVEPRTGERFFEICAWAEDRVLGCFTQAAKTPQH